MNSVFRCYTSITTKNCEIKKIVYIITKKFSLNYFPKSWRNAIVIMIHKLGKNPKNPSNYRPISLLNSLAKILEFIITNRLKYFVTDKLRSEQFAYRKPHSTTNQLMKYIDHLSNSINRNEKTVHYY